MSGAVKVEVRRTGRRFEAEAVLELAADAPTVWETITDYAALPDFMPGIRECRVLERKAGPRGAERLVVEQQGEFRFLLFAQSMTVLLHIDHDRGKASHAKAVKFDLGALKDRAIEMFEGRYEVQALASRRGAPRTRLAYRATIVLYLPPPPPIGSIAVRGNLTTQLEAVAAEVQRRAARRR